MPSARVTGAAHDGDTGILLVGRLGHLRREPTAPHRRHVRSRMSPSDPREGAYDLIEVHDVGDPRLADYADQKESSRKAAQDGGTGLPHGLFIAEGELVVRHLVRSRFRVRSVLLTRTRLATMCDALAGLPAGTPVYLVSQGVMNEVVGFNIHRGVLAAADEGPPFEARTLIAQARTLVVLEDLVNHDNIGGIFRSTAALAGAAAGILLSPRCADPMYRKAIRVSMGHVLRVPFARLEPWPGGLDALKQAGLWTIALTTDPAADRIDVVTLHSRTALLIGAEGPGLSPAALQAADQHVRIPMAPGVDSLNANTATAIALHRLAGNPEES